MPATASLLPRPDELFQSPFQPRELLAGIETPAPLGPFLGALLMLARAGMLFFRTCFVLVIVSTAFDNNLLPLLAFRLAVSTPDVDRVHHQPVTQPGARR